MLGFVGDLTEDDTSARKAGSNGTQYMTRVTRYIAYTEMW